MKKIFFAFTSVLLHLNMSAQTGADVSLFKDLEYRLAGPYKGGRVTAVAGIETQPNVFYMGATGGGIWKTTDYGQSWRNVSDGYFATGSIGAIRVHQKNPEIVYAGTGSDGIRSNVIIGKGVYKSSDAGESWKFCGLGNAGQIGAVELNPDNPDIAYVAAIGNPFGQNMERGLFRTTDGGNNWSKCLYISPQTGVCDVELCPGNPLIVYAAGWSVERRPWTIKSGSFDAGIYRSGDGGNTWDRLYKGLPQGMIGKSDLAVCPADPDILYVLIEAVENPGLYVSHDRGETFEFVSNQAGLLDRPFYYCNVDVDPVNPDKVYINSTAFYVSMDGGKTWSRRSTPHSDNHDMWINPSNTDIFIQSNDGGANITRDGGVTWSTQENQPTAELYQVDLDDQYPYWIYAGQQDNSTIALPSRINGSAGRAATTWYISVGGCETGPAVPKPGNPDIVYTNCKGRFGRYNKSTGQEKQYYVGAESLYGFNPADLKYRFQRVSPVVVSPHDPNIVYHGSQYLHMTRDEGVTWETISPDLTANEPDKQVISGTPITRDITGEEYYSTIYSIAESPVKQGVIWVGANDGPVSVTRDGGTTWKNVTPPDLSPGGRVQTIEASPHNPAKAYFAVYRYLLNDWKPYIYRTTDYGETWQLLTTGSNGIPFDIPARVIREDPEREGLLYAGTESGIFISFDDGVTWQKFQKNLPVVPVTDIKIFRDDLVLSTMGRSFWIMDNICPLRQFDLAGTSGISSPLLLELKEALKVRRGPGADIDYYLPAAVKEITITITDASGSTVGVFENSSALGSGDSVTEENWKQILVKRRTSVRTDEGFHRFVWDLATYGPVPGADRRSGGSGIQVVPGTYGIKLEADSITAETELVVLPDPLIVDDGVSIKDLQEQYDLAVQVRDLLSQARLFSETISSEMKNLMDKTGRKGKLTGSDKKDYEILMELNRKMVNDTVPYPQGMLLEQVSYLYSMLNTADQKPGGDAFMRYRELTGILSALKDEYKKIGKK